MFWSNFWSAYIPSLFILSFFYFVAAYAASYRKVNVARHGRWRKEICETSITTEEFVSIIQKVCLMYRWNLVEISPQHATIRTYPNLWSWGIFFYVEYVSGEQNKVCVYARGALRQAIFYRPVQTTLANMFYKA
jgi:hypothetical protein